MRLARLGWAVRGQEDEKVVEFMAKVVRKVWDQRYATRDDESQSEEDSSELDGASTDEESAAEAADVEVGAHGGGGA